MSKRRKPLSDSQLGDYAYLKMLEDPIKREAPCCLCGAPGNLIGIWVPSPATRKRLGEPPGKNRMIGYKLCSTCHDDPSSTARIENAILHDLQIH
jgi:hypothetical protein